MVILHCKWHTEMDSHDNTFVLFILNNCLCFLFCKERKMKKERIEAGIEPPQTREERKKKKQKEKPQAMSLDQFKQLRYMY